MVYFREEKIGYRYCRGEDRQDFLHNQADMLERFGIEINAYDMMDNKYHLQLLTVSPR